MNRHIAFQFRWPVKQVAEHVVEMTVPLGQGPAPISAEFIKAHTLSDAEVIKADAAVIRAISLIE